MVTAEEQIVQVKETHSKWFQALMEAVGAERAEELWELFPAFIYEKIEEAGEAEAVEWDLDEVKDYFYACRVDDWGNPTIQTSYSVKDEKLIFRNEKVMIKCVGGRGGVRNHQWFKHMPEVIGRVITKESNWRDWSRQMVKQGTLTTEEFMLISPFLMTPGVGLPEPEKKERVKRISIDLE